jgi:hypothetical protein
MKNLIQYLLQLGDNLNPDQVKVNYTKQELVVHQDEIFTVMQTIKPGMFSICGKKYTF